MSGTGKFWSLCFGCFCISVLLIGPLTFTLLGSPDKQGKFGQKLEDVKQMASDYAVEQYPDSQRNSYRISVFPNVSGYQSYAVTVRFDAEKERRNEVVLYLTVTSLGCKERMPSYSSPAPEELAS